MYWQTFDNRQTKAKLNKIVKGLDIAKPHLGKTFLDVGCGTGTVYGYLRPIGYTGIDFYQENIDVAKKLYPGTDFRQGAMESIVGEYDFVMCCRVLMHIENPEMAMEKLLRCGKLMVITELGEDRVDVFTDPGPHYYRTFSEKTMRSFGKCEIHKISRYSAILYE